MGNWFRPCTPCPSGKAVISASKFVIIFHIQEKEQPSFAHTAGTKRYPKGPHRRKDARRLEAASERQSRPPEISRNRCGYGGGGARQASPGGRRHPPQPGTGRTAGGSRGAGPRRGPSGWVRRARAVAARA